MAEVKKSRPARMRRVRHKGRASQILIYLGKQLRLFINENDWKVLPMAAIIAALVGMVIRKKIFISMEGCLIGGFALTCVGIWNGCFNSIQAVCRERAIIKREHRSGMHVSSYVAAHMIYQFFLCLLQTGLTMYVLILLGVQFPATGFMTPWMVLDMGISLLLIMYASDMMSLFISSISHTTTGAMTVMPFVLIFQLVFSGGIIPLPEWSRTIANFTISNYGIKVITAQAGYNELPMETGWKTLSGMRDSEIGGSVTLGQIMDLLDSPGIEKMRDREVVQSYTVGEAAEIISAAEKYLHLRDREITNPVSVREIVEWMNTADECAVLRTKEIIPAVDETPALTIGSVLEKMITSEEMQSVMDLEIGTTITLGQVLDYLHVNEVVEQTADTTLNPAVTVGQIVDFIKNNEALNSQRDRTFTVKTTMGELFDMFGEERVKEIVQAKTAAAGRNAAYDKTMDNIVSNWMSLMAFIAVFAFLAVLVLELIDKDKR